MRLHNLHIQTLQEYDGRGQCEEVVCYYATLKTYGDQLRAWAARVHWAVNFYKYDELYEYEREENINSIIYSVNEIHKKGVISMLL